MSKNTKKANSSSRQVERMLARPPTHARATSDHLSTGLLAATVHVGKRPALFFGRANLLFLLDTYHSAMALW